MRRGLLLLSTRQRRCSLEGKLVPRDRPLDTRRLANKDHFFNLYLCVWGGFCLLCGIGVH